MIRLGLIFFLIFTFSGLAVSQSTDVTVTYPVIEEINQHISEVAQNRSIPDNDTLIIRELDQIDASLAKASAIANWKDYDVTKYTQQKRDAIETIQKITKIKCAEDKGEFQPLYNKLLNSTRLDRSELWDRTELFDDSAFNILYNTGSDIVFKPGLQPGLCKALQAQLNDPNILTNISDVFDRWENKINESQSKLKTYRDADLQWLDLLKKRRSLLQEKLNSKSSQQAISGSLWIIMLVIGVFSTTTILLVKLFSPELQLEWVASGQVIQFVTVMILLSVIMALGLSNILKEETLGTLLGGIAGYVLAQGVGRAAAREVSRTAANRTTKQSHSDHEI